jgi:hypothetical protein
MNYYTYAYLREDRTPYYIGKGKGNRIYSTNGRRLKPPKDRSRIIFLKQNLTEEEAFKHEIYMIAVFGRKDLGTGILGNLTDGGEGPSNPSEETRKKKSVMAKNQMANRTPEQKSKASINATKLGYKLLEEKRGLFALTTEERKAIAKRTLDQGKGFASIPMEDRIAHGKRVIQQQKDTGTGIFGMTHEEKSQTSKLAWVKRKETGIGTGISPEQYKQIVEQQKKNKTALFSITPEQRSEIGKRGAETNKKNKTGIYGFTPEQRSEIARNTHKSKTPEEKNKALNKLWDGHRKYWEQFTPEQRSEMIKKQQANIPPERRTHNQRWQCTETGYVTAPGSLSRYQKKRGIDTSKRIKLS